MRGNPSTNLVAQLQMLQVTWLISIQAMDIPVMHRERCRSVESELCPINHTRAGSDRNDADLHLRRIGKQGYDIERKGNREKVRTHCWSINYMLVCSRCMCVPTSTSSAFPILLRRIFPTLDENTRRSDVEGCYVCSIIHYFAA
jgi:hypothetical protein